MKIVQKINAGYAVILIFMIIISTISYNSLKSVSQSTNWVNHTHEVIDMANLTGMAMIDMETGLRGYLVTGKENYLEPYYKGLKLFDNLIEKGKKKTSDNSVAVRLWIDIKNIEVIWNEYAQKMIAMRKEMDKGELAIQHFNKVSARILGKQLFDNIRLKLANLHKKFDKNLRGKILVTETTLALLNMETGQRGFLLSGKEESLEPYIQGEKDLKIYLDKIKNIISGTDVLKSDIVDIEHAILKWQEKVANVEIKARRDMNRYKVTINDITNEMSKGEGKTHMDSIREVLKKLIDGEKKLLIQREKEKENTMTFSNSFIILGNMLTIVIGIVISFLIYKNINNLIGRFQNSLLDFFEYLKGEKADIKFLDDSSKDEIGEMSSVVNVGIEKVKETIEYNEAQSWIKNGVNELNQILINLNKIKDVSYESIKFLSSYTNVGVGLFYLYDEKENILEQHGSYAHVEREEFSSKVKLGEGIVGQAGFEKKPILLENIDTSEALITTATVTQASYNTYTFPLIYNNKLYGVIELGSFEPFSNKSLEFFASCERPICVALTNAIANKKVNELLETTQKENK